MRRTVSERIVCVALRGNDNVISFFFLLFRCVRFEKTSRRECRIARNVCVIYAVGGQCRARKAPHNLLRFAPDLRHLCMRTRRVRSPPRRLDIAASLHGSVDDKPTKLIASARGRWRDFLRRPRERPASPPLIDAPDDLTKATESMNVAPLFLVFHPSCFLMRVQERADILPSPREARFFSGENSAIARALLLGRLAYFTRSY